MKRKRHNPEQIIRKLRESDRMLSEGKHVAVVCQALEVSERRACQVLDQPRSRPREKSKKVRSVQLGLEQFRLLCSESQA